MCAAESRRWRVATDTCKHDLQGSDMCAAESRRWRVATDTCKHDLQGSDMRAAESRRSHSPFGGKKKAG